MGLQRYCLFFAGLLIIALVAAAPVSAAPVITIDNTTPHALRDAVGSGSGAIIILNPGIYFEHDITIPIDIVIQANTTYGGSAADTIIDAGNSGRIFENSGGYDGGGYNLIIDSLTLKNGLPHGNGDGGAIYASGGSISLISSVISDCGAYNGGAIDADTGSVVTITASTISDCSASHDGGAIYADGSPVSVDGTSTIASCTASHDGGAIYAHGSPVSIDGSSTISGCSAANYGGAIRARSGSTVTVQSSSMITGCSADMGGAIWADDTVTITSSSISDCSASHGGGAIESTGTGGSVTLTSSTISGCSATDGQGGAIDSPDGGTVTIDSSTFSDCSANGIGAPMGGAIYSANGGSIVITSSTFSHCSATGGSGGAIADGGGPLSISSSHFNGCTASGYGGAIDAWSTTVTISSSTFSGCNAVDGGAIASSATFTITTSTFSDCSAVRGGVFSSFSGSSTTIHFCRIYHNSANAIYRWGGSVDAGNNWWGTNTDPAIFTSGSGVIVSPWLVLNATAAPSSVTSAGTSAIRANMTYNMSSTGTSYDASPLGLVPEGIPVAFAVTSGTGSVLPTAGNISAGANTTTFTPAYAGTTTLSATVDGQTVYTTLQVTQGPPAPSGITPNTGINTSSVSITNLAGSSFMNTGTTTVNLTRDGHANITATGVTVVDNTNITCTLPITGAEAGGWDVVVVNPDGQEGVLADGFTIIAGVVPTTVPTTASSSAVSSSSGSSDNDDDYWGTSEFPLMTVTVNIGGDSKAWQAIVTGTKLTDLIVTGTVQPGTGSNQTAPPGIIYQYISLVPARYTGITKAVINFTVPQAWLDENHIAPGSIVLYHQAANGWVALPTTVLYTKDGTVYFSAESTGFSLFAIAGTPAGTVPVTAATMQGISNSVVQTPAPAAAGVRAPVTSQTTAPPATTPQPAAPSPLLNVVLVIAAIGILAGGGFMVRRWWIRRQNPALFREYD